MVSICGLLLATIGYEFIFNTFSVHHIYPFMYMKKSSPFKNRLHGYPY